MFLKAVSTTRDKQHAVLVVVTRPVQHTYPLLITHPPSPGAEASGHLIKPGLLACIAPGVGVAGVCVIKHSLAYFTVIPPGVARCHYTFASAVRYSRVAIVHTLWIDRSINIYSVQKYARHGGTQQKLLG